MNETSGSNTYDVVVIGGGAAGLSAALVLSRARRRVVVVDSGRPRNAPAAQIRGFLGSDGLPPIELLAAGRAEVAGYSGRLLAGAVTDITPRTGTRDDRRRFAVDINGQRSLCGRRILVTTGLRDVLPDVPGVRERWGTDVLHCPYCHGYEVRDQPLGVLGGGVDAIAHAHLVRQWSDNVVFFNDGGSLTADQREQFAARAIGVVDAPVARLVVEDDRLTGVELVDGRIVPRRAVFVRPGFVPHDNALEALGCAMDDDGWATVDSVGRTSVPGVWAAGNAVNPRAQVITAAGEGSTSAIAINNDLVDEDLQVALAGFRLGMPV
jgi:thioredoxin reductase